MTTTRTINVMVVGIVVALASGCATDPKPPPMRGVELGESRTITAAVVAIDKADRTLTLRGPRGNVVPLEVSEAARNFDQISVGDQVRIEYYEAVAIYIGEPGRQPETDTGVTVARSAKGEKPAGYVVSTVDIVATVEAINRRTRTVTLRGPEGNTVTTTVDPSVRAFDSLSVGDSIHVRFTEAVAISVKKP